MALRRERLIQLLEESIRLVQLPKNDFMWSSWEDGAGATQEIERYLVRACEGSFDASSVGSIFLPTGPMQEVAESSGWGGRFLVLADRFDRLGGNRESCGCFDEPIPMVNAEKAGEMANAEFFVDRCAACGMAWCKSLEEVEGISGSGRWAQFPLWTLADPINMKDVRDEFERMDWQFFGGSYYGGNSGAVCIRFSVA